MNAPVIFCHYGNSGYLPYVLDAVTYTNPEKEIILLGDDSNRWLGQKKGVQHYPFVDFEEGNELATFNDVYQLVQGEQHGHMKAGKDWVNFVFKRWYYVYNFLRSKDYTDFWHFDSDNMILDQLQRHEAKFERFDCTEQCNGCCMNGHVSSTDVVRGYLQTINRLFQDSDYLNGLKQHFEDETPGHAFTEMTAYRAYQSDIHTIRLNSVIEGSTFDDCICQEHGMKMETFPTGKQIKRIHSDGKGNFFCSPLREETFIRLNSINLSWVPDELFDVVLRELKNRGQQDSVADACVSNFPTLSALFDRRFPIRAFAMRSKTRLRQMTRSGKTAD